MGEKKSLAERARRRFGGGTLSEMTVLYCNRRATVRGCRNILFYSPEEVRLALRGREICLRGRELKCVSFAGGSVTVEGFLSAVELSERRRET